MLNVFQQQNLMGTITASHGMKRQEASSMFEKNCSLIQKYLKVAIIRKFYMLMC